MTDTTALGGSFNVAEGLSVKRMGYGAMQLAGPGVFGPPKDHDAAIEVLQAVIETGINHIDTSDFYGPHITNQLIKEALYPYPNELTIVTKVGAKRDDKGNWLGASSESDLRQAVQDNLTNLGVDVLDIVNFRIHDGVDASSTSTNSIEKPFKVMAAMQQEGLIKHLGISNATQEQLAEAQSIAKVVCVQNMYNIANRKDDAMIDVLATQGIAYVPFFPLGGFSPLQSELLNAIADKLEAEPMQVALAWLLQRSPNILLIPGTSSIDHLYDNIASINFELPSDAVEVLNTIAG
jgi:pyridoxine 4-dehydrogenase